MTDGKEEGKRCEYECRDEGVDCDWRCETDDEAQLHHQVQEHKNQYHSIWSDNKEKSEYGKKPASE
jgi:predicted small metal-binding protein